VFIYNELLIFSALVGIYIYVLFNVYFVFTFFVPCIVIQLCNVKEQNAHFFKINVLIQFFVFSTCFEHHVFIIRKTIRTCSFYMLCFSRVYVSSLAGGRMC